MLDSSIKVRTDHFDGPLGLLLLLVQKHEMDIQQLDLTGITRQYLHYLEKMRELNFDVAGDYLYMAATLILLKSKSCIDASEVRDLVDEVEGPTAPILSRSELVQRLQELQSFQKLGQKLWQLPKLGHQTFTRPKIKRQEILLTSTLALDMNDLVVSMMGILGRRRRKFKVVRGDRISVKEKLGFLKGFLEEGQSRAMEDLMARAEDKSEYISELVVTFISLLELARLGHIGVYQNGPSSQIFVQVKKSLRDFDVESADGFAPVESDPPTEAEVADRALEG